MNIYCEKKSPMSGRGHRGVIRVIQSVVTCFYLAVYCGDVGEVEGG